MAIERTSEERYDEPVQQESTGEQLTEHMMIFYGRGKLDLEDPLGLLEKFYQYAPDRLHAHALWIVGRSLQQMDAVPLEVLERSRRLCEHRIEAAQNSPSPKNFRLEMEAVGWIFASLKFDDVWALTQLRNALEISGEAASDHDVIEHVARLAPLHPRTTVDCLGMMADGDREGWHIPYWGHFVREILEAALRSDDATAQEHAIALINRLGSRGFLEFEDLLKLK